MTWPEAIEKITIIVCFAFVLCVFFTGKWPWERD